MMTRDALRSLSAVPGRYLVFVMIPVEERIGEWRFAGRGDDLVAAFEAMRQFCAELGMTGAADVSMFVTELRAMEALAFEVSGSFAERWDGAALPPHRVVLLAEGDAPQDDVGFAVLEADHFGAFAAFEPETARPDSWP